MSNLNKYAGMPTYSRDVCSLMRRINALEHAVNILPSGAIIQLLDFDIYAGKVYCLVLERQTVSEILRYRIRVYDATTGVLYTDFNCPDGINVATSSTTIRLDAEPRIAVGAGYIYMPATDDREGQVQYPDGTIASFNTNIKGKMWRFSTGGDGLTSVEFDRWYFSFEQTFGPVGSLPIESFNHWVSGAAPGSMVDWIQPVRDEATKLFLSHIGRLQYVNGFVYGVGLAARPQFLVNTYTCANAFSSTYKILPDTLSDAVYGSLRFSLPNLFAVAGDMSSATVVANSLQSGLTQTFNSYYATGNQSLLASFDATFPSIIPAVSPCAGGALAVNGTRLYFDIGGDQDLSNGATVNFPFGYLDADGSDIVAPSFLHTGRVPTLQTAASPNGPNNDQVTKYLQPVDYATDGATLFSLEKYYTDPDPTHTPRTLAYRIRKYDLFTGLQLSEHALAPIGMRYAAPYLWLAFATPAGYGGTTAYMAAYDPTTMTEVFRFNIGDPMQQTEWYCQTATDSHLSLGTPDNGVSIPADEALATNGALKTAKHVIEMRNAIERVCTSYLASSGSRYHMNGSDNTENLYKLAMGDRTKYGATGGYRTTWTRAEREMWFPAKVYVDNVNYSCMVDHVAANDNKPGYGANWQTYWRVNEDGVFATPWATGNFYHVNYTFDIDIGEVDECVSLLEGSVIA